MRVFDEESLRVGRSLPQLAGAGRALNRQLPLAGPAVAHTQTGVGQSNSGSSSTARSSSGSLASHPPNPGALVALYAFNASIDAVVAS